MDNQVSKPRVRHNKSKHGSTRRRVPGILFDSAGGDDMPDFPERRPSSRPSQPSLQPVGRLDRLVDAERFATAHPRGFGRFDD